jgi:hypothetical protein
MPKYTTGIYSETGLRAVAESLRDLATRIDGMADGIAALKLDEVEVKGESDRMAATQKLVGWCGFVDDAIREAREARGDFARRVSDVSDSADQSPENKDLGRKSVRRSRGSGTEKD